MSIVNAQILDECRFTLFTAVNYCLRETEVFLWTSRSQDIAWNAAPIRQ